MGTTRHYSTPAARRGIRASAIMAAFAAALAIAPLSATATAELTDSAILGKLQFWVAADDAAHIATVDGKLRWFDKRETSTATPTRIYAESAGANNPTVATVATNNQSRTAMDFGDRNSGRHMAWKKPDGTTVPITDYNIRHVFAVYSMNGTFFGNIFGSVDSTISAFVYHSASLTDSTEQPFFINDDSRSIIWNGRAWFDGRRFDGYHERPSFALFRHGFHLLEVEPTPWKGGFANAFFSRYSGNVYGNGGGYLCEALTFTNALTEVERTLVEDYLMDRWSLGTRDKFANVADGEMLAIDASSGDVAEDRLRFAGSGTVRKTGIGTFTYASQTMHDFRGALEIAAGPVNLVTPLPVAASAGDRFTVTAGAGRIVTRTADAGAGAIVKDGAGELTLAEVPADVTQLDVRAGTLTVRRKPANVGRVLGSPVSVVIPNADFEDIIGDAALDSGCTGLVSSTAYGWRGNASYLFHWPTWKDTAPSAAVGKVKGSSFLGSVPPPSGTCALYFYLTSSWAETDVTIPAPGVYELTLGVYGRNGDGFLGKNGVVTLLDEGGNVVARFGRAIWVDQGRVGEKTLKAEIPAAGTYRLRFDSTGAFAIDNLRLAKVAEIDPDAFPIPNGDFEDATMRTGADAKAISSENTCDGWTLGLDSGTLNATQPEVALTTRTMQQSGRYEAYNGGGAFYNDSRAPRGGYVELLFRKAGAYATTATFTAPAGTNYLRCAAAYINVSPATIEATVAVGGQTISLGSLAPDNKLMRDRFFPVPLTLDAPAAATLTLRCTEGGSGSWTHGTVIDDLAFVPFADEAIGDNLVANGDFEATAAPYGWSVANGWVNRTYSEAYGALGTDPSGGSQFLSLHGAGTFAVQDIAFPITGCYRLRFRYRNRNSSGFASKPVTAWLAKDSATNVLCRVGVSGNDVKYTAYVDEIADFDVPEAATYRLGLSATAAGHTFIDDVEIRRISDRFDDSVPVCTSDLEISVAQGAHVVLDFRGVQKVESLRLGGHYVSGLIGAGTFPEYLSGSGILDVPARATVIIMK